jgi:hypothetical protein
MRPASTAQDQVVEPAAWGLCWHAALGREFFTDAQGPASLVERIKRRLIGAHESQGRVLIDYVLLPTEIHAVSRLSAGESVGGIARAFGNVLSRWVREEQPVRSPVLAGPYRAQALQSVEDLRNELRMLAWRPVMLGLCSTPTHYPHGALRIASGLSTGKGFSARPMLELFGTTVSEARVALRRWMRHRPSAQEWRAWELTRGLELATGSVGPRQAMARAVHGPAAMLIAAGGTYGIDGALALLAIWSSAKIDPANPPDLHAGSTAKAARGRALVACLAVDHRLCSAASVARYFHRAKATFSEQMSACRARPSDRIILGAPLRRILEEAASLQVATARCAGSSMSCGVNAQAETSTCRCPTD